MRWWHRLHETLPTAAAGYGTSRRRFAAALMALWSWALGARADGLPTQLDVRWSAPLHCPRTGGFDRELLRLLGPDASAAVPSEIDVQVEELPGGLRRYRLRLQLTAEAQRSERVLELTSCEDVRHAAALLIATALHDATQAAAESPPSAASTAWDVRVGALGDLGTLPALTAGPELALVWVPGPLQVAIGAGYLLPREARDDSSRLRADMAVLAGSLGAAYVWQLGSMALGPTLAVELGTLRARAQGEQGRDESTLWLSALAGGRADLALGERVGLVSSILLSVPLRKPTFSLAAEPPFYETRAVALRVGIGVRVRFGSTNKAGSGQ